MNIVLFTHPDFLSSQSMPRFASMILEGMERYGHTVTVWTASPCLHNMSAHQPLKKWLGYIDQFIIFPLQVRARIKQLSTDTLFVFSDQALGPWVPLVAQRPHVVHVHDFLALRSALGEYQQNPTGWSGRKYQAMIRRGFGRGKNFISVSKKTQLDLTRFLPAAPHLSEVIYNGLNFPFHRMSEEKSKAQLANVGVSIPSEGFLIHVGGNQWYKNRVGVLEIYEAYVKNVKCPLPLLMVGAPPTKLMTEIVQRIGKSGKVNFLSGLSNDQVCAAYSLAEILIFPSIAEGFGWPIAEAMACGCLVLTTNDAPMTEVGGDAAFYIEKKSSLDAANWALVASQVLDAALSLSVQEKQARRNLGIAQAAKFDTNETLQKYEAIYKLIVDRRTA